MIVKRLIFCCLSESSIGAVLFECAFQVSPTKLDITIWFDSLVARQACYRAFVVEAAFGESGPWIGGDVILCNFFILQYMYSNNNYLQFYE